MKVGLPGLLASVVGFGDDSETRLATPRKHASQMAFSASKGHTRKPQQEQIGLAYGANMVPLFILMLSFVVLRGAGVLGVTALNNVDLPLRIAIFLMFLVTASAHWGKGRSDLIRMVPPLFPYPAILVSVTGVLEILGAVGLLVSVTTRLAAVCLAILLVALFPANVRAARKHLTILGRPAPDLFVRGAIQVIFLSVLIIVIVHDR